MSLGFAAGHVLERSQPFLPHLAPGPAALDHGAAPYAQSLADDDEPSLVKRLFELREMRLARLELCLCGAELGGCGCASGEHGDG